MASLSWEAPGRLHSWGHSDEGEEVEEFGGTGSDDDGWEEGADTPGQQLVALLLERMFHSRLLGQQCCALMFWAENAGVAEEKPYARRAEACIGHASRKLRSALGHESSADLYEAELLGHSRHACNEPLT